LSRDELTIKLGQVVITKVVFPFFPPLHLSVELIFFNIRKH
jgi:hypothetical protein